MRVLRANIKIQKTKIMGTPTDIRKGSIIMYNGKPHAVMSMMHRTPGRRLGFVQTVLRNLETNSSTAVKFKSTDDVEFCFTTNRDLEYSYSEGANFHFLDNKTFDDVVIPESTIGEDVKWLREGTTYQILFVDNEPVSIKLPMNVDLKVAQASEGLRGDSSGAGSKAVTLENGMVLQVPLFIKQGDIVKVRTEDESYVSRA